MSTALTTWTTPTSQNPGIEYHLSYSVTRANADQAVFTINWTVYTTSGSFAYDLDLKADTPYSSAVTDRVVTGSDGITASSGNSGSMSFTCSGLSASGGSITMTLTGIRPGGGATGTGSTTRTITYGAKYNTAAAPSSASASRINTTTNRVTWTNNSTSDAPYSYVVVDRSTDGFVTWTTSANLASNTTSWDDTAATATATYQYRVSAYGSSGAWSSRSNSTTWSKYISPVPASTAFATTVTTDPANDGANVCSSGVLTITHPTFNSTYNTPDSWDLELWKSSTNSWVLHSSPTYVAGATASVNVSGLTADNQYVARVRYYNIAGNTAWVNSNTFYTSVASPTGPTVSTKLNAVRSGLNVALSWINPSTVANNTEVWWSTSSNGGSTWSAFSKIATLTAATTTYTHTGPTAANQHKYKVINTTTSGLVSHPLASDPVQLLTAPLAPVISGCPWSANTTAFDVADTSSVTLSWVHSPVDGTTQTGYELQVRNAGAAWPSTTKTVSTASSVSHPLLTNGITVEWRVRTWGQHTDPSAWSATGSFVTNAKPTCAITTPAAPLTPAAWIATHAYVVGNQVSANSKVYQCTVAGTTSSTAPSHTSGAVADGTATWIYICDLTWRLWPAAAMTVAHTYTDSEASAQKKHRTELWDAGETTLLWYSEATSTATTDLLGYTLNTNTKYVIKKKVMDSAGLWSALASTKIQVIWETMPSMPDPALWPGNAITLTGLTATINWTAPASANDGNVGDSGKNPWTHLAIERWDNVTDTWSFIKNVTTKVSGSTTDTLIANRKYQYRVKAQALKNSVADASVILTATSPILTENGYLNTVPNSPASLSVSQPSDIVILSWVDASTYPVKVEIQRINNDVSGSSYQMVAMVDSAQGQFPDLSVNEDTSYTYRCRAVYGSLTGAWTEPYITMQTKTITNATLHGVTVPPVRRNGPRESEKENVEAAEIGAIAALVRQKVSTLNADVASLSSTVGTNNETMYSGIEAARLKTEIK